MPVAQLFAIIGDGNVRRNMTATNIASRPAMPTAKIIDCVSSSTFRQGLRDVPDNCTICVVQCLTAILAGTIDTGSIFSTVDPVLTEFGSVLREFCASRSNLLVTVMPPTFRETPVWYRRHLSQVAQQFSSILSQNRPANLHLLSSPGCQDLCPDGVHFTPVAGLHFILHLFDDAQRVVSSIGARGIIANTF